MGGTGSGGPRKGSYAPDQMVGASVLASTREALDAIMKHPSNAARTRLDVLDDIVQRERARLRGR